MKYDESKDKLISKKEVIPNELFVNLYQYDGGEKKIAIQKMIVIKDKEQGFKGVLTNKIGRINLDVAKVIVEKINEIIDEYYTQDKPKAKFIDADNFN